jgi:riboflavin kinase/FMN adenylyltransferase
MEIINDMNLPRNIRNPVVTIGNFDGVHIGHQKIFNRTVQKAKELNGTPVVITFHPHPIRVLAPDRGLKLITTVDDKRRLIESSGVEVLICLNFTKDFAKTDPDDFIKEVLVEKLGVKWVVVGHNYAFGKGKKGNADLLRRRGRKYGFGVSVVRYAKVYDDIVSSSRVRSLILRGRVCEASRLLGRAYHIGGTVIKGAGRGGVLLHTPTANISTHNELIPKEGVYAVKISFALFNVYEGVANIGKNPTFGDVAMSYEAHIFDFDKNIVGEEVRVHFIDRIRDEKKFSGIGELESQIKKDIKKAKEILSKRKDPLFLS